MKQALWLWLPFFPIVAVTYVLMHVAWQEDQATLAKTHQAQITVISVQQHECIAVLSTKRQVPFQPRTVRADGSVDCYLEDVK